ncbi:pyridoxamine 5'-phosphate oxidase family protein [Agromyces lapidis]|uniref:Pyridoxamine 5'-phosphate oxidase family protein n=1 Tax=Agromyces lapidis TaxID=279574 RepID=A0ABV5SVS0_9MICO|nr:pyridoxamine 5'-phosphate oxidase family protein [Agromyces lapidis]
MTDEAQRPPMREMRSAECWQRITEAPYGRIATAAAGELDVFPVNHGVDRYSIVFRTAAGTKLLALTVQRKVVFQIDGVDGDEAFSVVVKGDAEQIDRAPELEAAERLGVRSWAPGEKNRWVRITPRDIQGRAFALPRPGPTRPASAS